jgi:ribosome-binding protein aMBF1 (putative translation factor)
MRKKTQTKRPAPAKADAPASRPKGCLGIIGARDSNRLIADLIREARQQAGLTLKEVGERLGSTKQTAYYFESKRSSLTVDTLARLAAALGARLKIEFEFV